MAEQKIKVSELPEQEQKDLIAEAVAVGLKGVFPTWNVDTLKSKIAEAKGEKTGKEEKEVIVAGDGGVHEIPSENEQPAGENEQEAQVDEQNGSNDEQKAEEMNETGKDENQGDGGNKGEGETKEEAKEPQKPQTQKVKQPKQTEVKKGGVCHICRSKVINGVCTGCGFHK